jgi:hypothetical protein
MDLRSKTTLIEVQEVNKELQLARSTQSFSPLKTKDLSSPNGAMKLPVELDEGTTGAVTGEKQSSTISSPPSNVCCPGAKSECRRTWVANNPGKLVAYMLYPNDAEGWMADTDDRRNAVIKAGYRRTSVLWLFDAWWTTELVLEKIHHIIWRP